MNDAAASGPETRSGPSLVRVGECAIDLSARQVAREGHVIELTAMEFNLFAFLAVRPGQVYSREQLLNAVWHSASDWQQAATVTEHVRRLRNKIEPDPRHPTTLVTVRGAGYRLDLPTTGGTTQTGTSSPSDSGVLVHVDGRIVFADQVAGALAGADPATLVGMQVLSLVAPASLVAANERLADRIAGRSSRSAVMAPRNPSREQRMVEVRSAPTVWQGALARRVEVTPLSDEPERLRRLVTGVLADVADAVIITDVHGHIRSWNAAAERIYGWSEERVVGRHLLDIVQWGVEEAQLALARDDLAETGRWHGSVRHTAHDGSTVDILGTTTVLRDDGGEPIGTVSVNRLVEVAGRPTVPDLDTEWAARIRQGIANDEFVVHYQPIVDLVDGNVLALEALVRWEHPERGLLVPADFLETAERSGSIVELGEFVIDVACRQAAAWRRSGADILLWVNVSARQVTSPSLTERFVDILGASGFDPACLWIEVTETAVVEELETASDALGKLVDLGVGVSIDDFGTGWASLTYLQNFPVHALKIDGSFVAGAGRDDHNTAIVRSILSLGAELGLAVVAEGIETAVQRDVLRAMGATVGQGYFYGRPGPADDVPVERARRVPDVAGESPSRSTSRLAGLPPVAATEQVEADAVATLLRGLLRIDAAPAAVELLHRTVRRMGGTVVALADAHDDALLIDVSLGAGPPLVVEAERLSVARMQLERLLPRLVEDARRAVDLLRRAEPRPRDTTPQAYLGTLTSP